MFKSLSALTITTSECEAIFKPDSLKSSFELLEINQRDLVESHVNQFGDTTIPRFSANPALPVLVGPVTLRVVPHPRKEAAVTKALMSGQKPKEEWIMRSDIADGQHRYVHLRRALSQGMDMKFIAVVVVCSDEDSQEVFYDVNGRAMKMAPCVVDLALARKYLNGNIIPKDRNRAISSLITYEWAKSSASPYGNKIQRPFAAPPMKWTVPFHRIVSSLRANIGIELSKQEKPDWQLMAANVITAFTAIGHLLYDEIYGEMAVYGETRGFDDWVHGPLIGILLGGMVAPFLLSTEGAVTVKQCTAAFKAPLAKFMAWGLTTENADGSPNIDQLMRVGLVGIGGNSSEAPYTNMLRSFVNLEVVA